MENIVAITGSPFQEVTIRRMYRSAFNRAWLLEDLRLSTLQSQPRSVIPTTIILRGGNWRPNAGKAWPKITQNTSFFWQNLVVFGQKILIFTGERKSFGTQITEKTT